MQVCVSHNDYAWRTLKMLNREFQLAIAIGLGSAVLGM